MEKSMNNEILKEVDKIIAFIKASDIYQDYLFLEEKLHKNEKVSNLIKEIKKLQKELVKKEAKNEDITDLNNQINTNLEELNRIPLYVEYTDKQAILNEMYQTIKSRLDDYFYDKLN